MCIKADLSQESRSAGKLRQKMACDRRVHHTITSPGEFPPYARNMLWRTVAVLPLADRQWQPYASSVTIAASIDRAGVRPFSLHTKPHHESSRCHKDELKSPTDRKPQ